MKTNSVSAGSLNCCQQLVYAEGAEDVISYEFLTGSDGKRGYRHTQKRRRRRLKQNPSIQLCVEGFFAYICA